MVILYQIPILATFSHMKTPNFQPHTNCNSSLAGTLFLIFTPNANFAAKRVPVFGYDNLMTNVVLLGISFTFLYFDVSIHMKLEIYFSIKKTMNKLGLSCAKLKLSKKL